MSDIIQGSNPFTEPSFTFKNRARRMVWNTVSWLFFRTSPRVLHGWRRGLLRLFGAKIGKGCKVYPAAVVWAPWNLEMADLSTIADRVNVYSMATISLGERVIVSQGAHLCAGSHDYESKSFQLYVKPITIKADAWLCAECFIGPGVTVNEGAVVGARCVTFADVPPWTVVAGNPSREVKKRVIRDL